MWDMRGFTPIHSAAYNGQKEAIKLFLAFQSRDIDLDVDCLSRYEETPLHIACHRGNVEVTDYLECKGADIGAVDKDGNTVLHYASSSNSQSLMEWLLRRPGVREKINMKNKHGHTPAHRAVIFGCPNSVSVLLTHGADFNITDSKGRSALKLAELLTNIQCHRNATRPTSRRDQTLAPTSSQSGENLPALNQITCKESLAPTSSQSGENLPALNPPQLQPQHSHSSAGSFQSLHEAEGSPRGSPRPLRRRPSITGTTRPVNLSVPKRVPSLRQASSVRRASSLSYHSEEGANIYLSKEALSRVSRNLEHQDSLSWEDTSQMLYNNTAYEPPPDITFIPPITKEMLTFNNPRVHCQTRDLKLRLLKNYWDKNKEEEVEVCLCAAMHLNCSFSEGYTIVSPVCFMSLKSQRPCEVDITLPHAIANVETVKEKICILSMTTIDPNLKPDSPLSSPTERTLVHLQGIEPQAEKRSVKFKTSLACPSLFVVAVRDRPPDLRCSLFVIYPELDPGSSVTGFDVEAYIGMSLKTVTTAVTMKERCRVEEAQHFILTSDSQLEVRGSLTNPITDWEIEPRGRGDLRYTQVALTQDTDSDAYTSYSHQLVYPPCKRFFIEPKAAASAIKCNITVIDSQRELCRLLVVPFAPKRDPTPERTHPPSHESSHSPATSSKWQPSMQPWFNNEIFIFFFSVDQ